MTIGSDRVLSVDEQTSGRELLGSAGFACGAVLAEFVAIVLLAVVTGVAYHMMAYGTPGDTDTYLALGALAAFCYVLPFMFRDEYGMHAYLEGRRDFGRTFFVWNTAFLALALIGFLTKTTGVFSRAWLLLFYLAGLSVLTALSALTGRVLVSLMASGLIGSRRLMLVGSEDEIRRVAADFDPVRTGVRVVAMQVLTPAADTDDAMLPSMSEAVALARARNVNDIVLVTDWSRTDFIHGVVEAFSNMPVAIHLGASGLLGRFSDARVSRMSPLTALSLTAPPLGPMQVAAKRTFDVVCSSLAIVLLLPLFAVIAAAIRLDTPGPIFFRQRRRGYNNREFLIWKFRTMTSLDDGDVVVQVQSNDLRVTRIGRLLRRFNLDELPQLINVVRGEMSLVGPRPHAVAHDRHYEVRIGSYPRRLNVKPGITGWAQVNGFRGRTETDEDMRGRVERDLYYIDNWSILFDLYILALTVLSPKAYKNAM